MIYTDQMFNATANATTLTQLQSGISATAGTWPVPVLSRLIKVVIVLAGQAATSLLEALRVELSASTWTPNVSRFGAAGGALRTAPAFPINPSQPYELDQPCSPSQPITGNYLFNVTAVTPNIQVFGEFSTNMIALAPYRGS